MAKRKSQGKPCVDSSQKKTWLQDDGKTLKCCVCLKYQKYPSTVYGSNR